MTRLWLVVSILALAACGGDGGSTGPEVPEGFGRLAVTLARAPGGAPVLFSALIQVADRPIFRLMDDEVTTVSNVPAGTQTIEASALTPSCSLQGQNPRSVSVVANQLTQVTLDVTCTFDEQPRVLFLLRKANWEYDVWTVNTEGNDLTQITFDGITLTPNWSPDGTRVAVSKGSEIWMMNFDGTEDRLIAEQAGTPAWSPDGERILFSRQVTNPGATNIWVMDADGSNQEAITEAVGFEQTPAWSPDGQRIAFCSRGQFLFVMDSDGGNPVELTGEMGCSFPVWSPDGEEIIFAGGQRHHEVPEIYRMGADGSQLTRLTEIPGGCAAPTYSPDGTSILFNTHGDGNDLVEGAWIMDLDGGNPRQFGPIPMEGASFVRWWGG